MIKLAVLNLIDYLKRLRNLKGQSTEQQQMANGTPRPVPVPVYKR